MKRLRYVSMAIVLMLVMGVVGFPKKATSKSPTNLKPIVWGFPASLGVSNGYDDYETLTYAVDEINKAGGIRLPDGMHPIKLETMDTRNLEPGVPVVETLLCIERLIQEKKADFIIGGPARSEATLAAMDMSTRFKKVLMIGSGGESPGIFKKIVAAPDKYPYVWSATSAIGIVGTSVQLFDLLRDKWGFKKFSIITQDTSWARGFGKAFSAILPKGGWEQVSEDVFPLGSTDFSSALLTAKRKEADIITGGFDMPQSAIMMKQWALLKVPALIVMHISPAQTLAFWKASEGKCEYSLIQAIGITSPRISPWAERYMKWAVKMDNGDGDPIQDYLQAYCLKEAIEIAGSLDADAVSRAMLKVDIKNGPTGRLRFDPKTHLWVTTLDPKEGNVMGWFQWQAGKRVFVYPEALTTGKLKLPPWRK